MGKGNDPNACASVGAAGISEALGLAASQDLNHAVRPGADTAAMVALASPPPVASLRGPVLEQRAQALAARYRTELTEIFKQASRPLIKGGLWWEKVERFELRQPRVSRWNPEQVLLPFAKFDRNGGRRLRFAGTALMRISPAELQQLEAALESGEPIQLSARPASPSFELDPPLS